MEEGKERKQAVWGLYSLTLSARPTIEPPPPGAGGCSDDSYERLTSCSQQSRRGTSLAAILGYNCRG